MRLAHHSSQPALEGKIVNSEALIVSSLSWCWFNILIRAQVHRIHSSIVQIPSFLSGASWACSGPGGSSRFPYCLGRGLLLRPPAVPLAWTHTWLSSVITEWWSRAGWGRRDGFCEPSDRTTTWLSDESPSWGLDLIQSQQSWGSQELSCFPSALEGGCQRIISFELLVTSELLFVYVQHGVYFGVLLLTLLLS